MKKNQAILGGIFTVVSMLAALYFQKGHGIGLFFQMLPGAFVGILIGAAFAWYYTNEDNNLDPKEAAKATTFALGTSVLITALIVLNGLRAINDYTAIPYAFEAKGWDHGSEILLRVILGLAFGILLFVGQMAMMSKLVRLAALTFGAKVDEWLSATPTAATPAAPAAAAAPATGTAAPATTTTDDKGSIHPIVWVIIIAVGAVLLSPLFGGGGSSTQSGNNGQQQTTTQQSGQNGVPGASGVQTPDPNAPLTMPDETPGAH